MNTICNVHNRTIFCQDNLEILQGMNSTCVDLIYLDPPFNKKKVFAAPIGAAAEGASFKDIFTEEDIKENWIHEMREGNDKEAAMFIESVRDIDKLKYKQRERALYNYCYLSYMGIRLIEMRRILKETGSIYLHCDPTMSHYLKLLMDCIFGEKNFRNEIVWGYKGDSNIRNAFLRKHDIILLYAKSSNTFNRDAVRVMYSNDKTTIKGRYGEYTRDTRGKKCLDWWADIPSFSTATNSRERVGYPTQKPVALLTRIILASSNEGDIVLDPFCGCATACVAAEKLGRTWIGIDVSVKAYELVQKRLRDEVWEDPNSLYKYEGSYPEIHYSVSAPTRTDQNSGVVDKKYVYIISNPHFKGKYKVGIARNVTNRLNSYQIGDPDRGYQLEYSLETEYYRGIEKHIHTIFENNHEWVIGDFEDIKREIEEYQPIAELLNEP